MAEKHEEIGERHLELLRVAADLARNDPAAIAQMYRAAQRMNLNTVGKQADRAEFLGLVRDLEGAGCVEVKEAAWRQATGCSPSRRKGIGSWKQPRSEEHPSEAPEPRTAWKRCSGSFLSWDLYRCARPGTLSAYSPRVDSLARTTAPSLPAAVPS